MLHGVALVHCLVVYKVLAGHGIGLVPACLCGSNHPITGVFGCKEPYLLQHGIALMDNGIHINGHPIDKTA